MNKKAVVIGICALSLCAQEAPDFYSLEKERGLGKQLAEHLRRQEKSFNNSAVDAYAKRIGSYLVAHVSETPFVYSFEVVLTETSEPMSLPGGYIFIPAKFFLSAQNEDEFATMLAHSIGHTALRHGTRRASKGQVTNGGVTPNTATIPLIFMGGWMGSHADSSQRDTLLVPLGFAALQRKNELEADTFGVKLASLTGYNVGAFRNYVQRVQSEGPQSNVALLPPKELRLANIDEILRQLPVVSVSSAAEFLRNQEVVREVLKTATHPEPSLRRP